MRHPRMPQPRPAGAAPLRAACAFAAGGLVPCAAWFVLLPALGALDFYRGATILRPAGVLALACVAGGAVAGGALGPGLRLRAAFGAAFAATFWMPLLVLGSLPALSGGERFVDLLAGFAPVLALSHALLGALGIALGGGGWRRAAAGALLFGPAGAAGGVLLALVVRLSAGSGGGAAAFAVGALGGAAACLLPLTIGGWWLARRPAGRGARGEPGRGSGGSSAR